MQRLYVLLIVAHCTVAVVTAQGVWLPKSSLPSFKENSVSFEIGGKGYVYLGTATNNFYEYNPVTNSWTQKADFPGGSRSYATGFAIDSLGYVGTGSFDSSFYRYSPATNTWTAIAHCPLAVSGAFGFSVSGKGYVVSGGNNTSATAKGYSYNPATNSWTPIADIPNAMFCGFSSIVGNKAYCGLGSTSFSSHSTLMFEYDPALNVWTSKSGYTLPGYSALTRVQSFVLNGKIYVANPSDTSNARNGTTGIYDPVSNTWSSIKFIPGTGSFNCKFAHVYAALSIAGNGYVGAGNGCTLSNFWQLLPNDSFEILSITPDTVCENGSVQISFSSSLSFNSGNKFVVNFRSTNASVNTATSDSISATGGGTFTVRVPSVIQSGQTPMILSVQSTDPLGESGFFPKKIIVKNAPSFTAFAPSYHFCSGSALLLYRTQQPGVSHQWSSFPPGVTGSSYQNSINVSQNTTVYVTDMDNATGCSISDSTLIVYNHPPSLGITDSAFYICKGSSITIGGTNVVNATYAWSATGFSSSSQNPVVSPTVTTTYRVTVTDTLSGCKTSGNTTVYVSNPPAQSICLVTVDSSSTHNIVVWEKINIPAVDSYYIYREITTGNYQVIGAVHSDSLSEYHDYAANPNITAYRYKIAAKDTCGDVGTQSLFHNTIHLKYLGSGNLIWNVYEIENTSPTPVASFDVLYDANANGNWQLLVTVPGNQYTATDVNFSQHPQALYRVVANWSYTCTPSRSSKNAVLSNILAINASGIDHAVMSNRIYLFPVPAQHKLYVQTNNIFVSSLKLLTMEGKTLAEYKELPEGHIDIGNLAAGTYLLQITTPIGNVLKKFAKM